MLEHLLNNQVKSILPVFDFSTAYSLVKTYHEISVTLILLNHLKKRYEFHHNIEQSINPSLAEHEMPCLSK